MLRLHNWIHLHNAFTIQNKLVSTIRSSQFVCMLMKQKNDYYDVTKIKDKTRITLVVGTLASGKTCHLL